MKNFTGFAKPIVTISAERLAGTVNKEGGGETNTMDLTQAQIIKAAAHFAS